MSISKADSNRILAATYPFGIVLSTNGGATWTNPYGGHIGSNVMFSKSDPMKFLAAEEDLYDLLTDCEMLYASAPVCEVY